MGKKSNKQQKKERVKRLETKGLPIQGCTKSKCCKKYKKTESKRCKKCPCFDLIKKVA